MGERVFKFKGHKYFYLRSLREREREREGRERGREGGRKGERERERDRERESLGI